MIDKETVARLRCGVLAEQRRRMIVTALTRSSFVALHDAVELTGASEATIRRDFTALESNGIVRRHRGGVEIREAPVEPLVSLPLDIRLAVQDDAKRRIAERAVRLCTEGETVFLDAGSTALRLAPHLAAMAVRVITNSFAATKILFDGARAEVVVTGGQIDRASEVVYSYEDFGIVESYPPDVAFLGAQGIDANGYYNSDERLIRLEREVARAASRTVLVADSTKFGQRGRIRVAGLDELDVIVTDAGVPADAEAIALAAGVELIKVR